MDGVQFLFVDPGFKNLGLLALKFISDDQYQIKYGNFEVTHDKRYHVDYNAVEHIINQIVSTCNEDFILFMEENSFPDRDMQKAYGRLTGFIESSLIFKRMKQNLSVDFRVLSSNPRHYNSILGINSLKLTAAQRKHRVNLSFMWVFNIEKEVIPSHVSDAFCTGVCHVLKNWKNSEGRSKNEQALIRFAQNFQENVKVPQLDYIGAE